MKKEELRGKLRQYLEMKGLPTAKNSRFRCLNPNHEDVHPSMAFNEIDNRVHCFSCGVSYDVFDLIRMDYNLTNFNDIYRKACEIFSVPVSTDDYIAPGDFSSLFFLNGSFFLKGDEAYGESKMDLYESAYKNVKKAMIYLQGRGIDPALAQRYGIGYYYGYKILGKSCNAILFPIDTTHYMVRNELPDAKTPYRYYKQGASPFPVWNLDSIAAVYKSGHPLYVTEGIIDALSIITAGGMAVALNGVANVDMLVNAVREVCTDDKQLTVIAACDNDAAGREANDKIVKAVRLAGHRCYCLDDLYGDCNDANDALRNNRDAFVSRVKELQTEHGMNRLVFAMEESDGALLEQYLERMEEEAAKPYVSTGFPSLDSALHGGLRGGLYMLGSLPSIGKTTLWVQLKDSFCRQRQDVLFFSLETSMFDLYAKTISRLMYEHSPGLAKDAVSCQNGRVIERFTDEEKRLFYDVLEECRGFSRYCTTFAGMDTDVESICTIVRDYIRRTGTKPVVLVDYLQILRSQRYIADERLRLLEVIQQLKSLALDADIPVLVISSINRTNYKNNISFESFFGSGGIEYFANVLFGLQYRGMDKPDFDLKAAENAETRKLELVVLKYKDGLKNVSVPLNYVPKFNYFTEEQVISVVKKKGSNNFVVDI